MTTEKQLLVNLQNVWGHNFTLFKNDLLQPASLKFNQAEIAIPKSTAIKIGLLPMTFRKIAVFKKNMIEDAFPYVFPFSIH